MMDAYSYRDRIDPTLAFLYRPHSISALIMISAGLIWTAFFQTSSTDSTENVLKGFLVGTLVFIFIGTLQLRDGPFIRPHPVMWRAVLATSIAYFLFLVVLLFQQKSDARRLIAIFDPSLGVALPERSYAEDCSLTWEAIWPQLDIFVVAHIVGWYVKTLLLRDAWIAWIISIMFEVMEYSLAFQLPNFAECWWDHWILDVLLCNWLGIWLGMKTCYYFSMKTYYWRGIRDIPDLAGKMKRVVAQLTPHSWTSFDWAATKSFKGYLATIILVTMVGGWSDFGPVLAATMHDSIASEVNCFYLKYLLWIPPSHYLNVIRIILHALMGAVAIRETYQYFTDVQCGTLGPQAWMICAIIITESLICIKFSQNEFPSPIPARVVQFWIVFGLALIVFPFWQFYLKPRYAHTSLQQYYSRASKQTSGRKKAGHVFGKSRQRPVVQLRQNHD